MHGKNEFPNANKLGNGGLGVKRGLSEKRASEKGIDLFVGQNRG